MTPQEFKREFDLLYNNIMSDMAPGLDDYEISLFLTQAQEELVSQLYGGGQTFDGFESTEKIRRSLANLIHTTQVTTLPSQPYGNFLMYPVALPDTLLVLVSEKAQIQNTDCCSNSKWVNVAPVKYDELNKVLENPFRRPNNRQVLRIDTSSKDVRIISKAILTKYEYVWLQKPTPIIVSNLPSEYAITVGGVSYSTAHTSDLDESLHRPIIKYAVQLAAASWASNNKSQ